MVRTTFSSVRLQIERESISASDITQSLIDLGGLHDATQETMWVISYDSLMSVRTVVEVARGGYHSMDVPIPAILSAVLLAGVDRFVIAHNHSSGDVSPTEPDMDLTRKVMSAANDCGLFFEDHIILSPNGDSFSMASEGIIIQSEQIKAMARTNRRAKIR